MRFFCKILFIILLIAEGYPQIKASNRTHFSLSAPLEDSTQKQMQYNNGGEQLQDYL